jgi:hypothetical protein
MRKRIHSVLGLSSLTVEDQTIRHRMRAGDGC